MTGLNRDPHPRSLGARARLASPYRLASGWAFLLGSLLGASPTPSAAQTAALPSVSITATRTATRVDDTLAETTVLQRPDLERESGRSLASMLAQQSGIQMSANGGPGQYASAFMRGMEARHTLVLVDGMRLGSATVGVPALSNLPLEAFEQIDIVRGPMSALYGSDAVGGVVQVFTRRGQEGFWPSAGVGLGSMGQRQAHGGLRFGEGGLDGAVHIGRTLTRGFSATHDRALWGAYNPDADGFAQSVGSLNLGAKVAPDWRIEGSVLSVQGQNHYDDGLGADARARLRNDVQTLRARGLLRPGWSTQLAVGQSSDVYDTQVSASPYAELGATQTRQRQVSWEHTLATRWGTALALVERLDQRVSRPGAAYDVSDRTIDAVGLGLSGEQGRHTWQGGVRHDHNSQFGAQNTGTVGYGLNLSPSWRLGAQLGSSFVAPSFNQLYYPGFGNPNLQPEEGRHGEASLRWTGLGQTLRAAWVDNRIRGYIPSGPQPVNVPRTQIDGLVFSYDGTWQGLQLGASYEHLDPRNTTAGPAYGLALPRRAAQALRARADYTYGRARLGGSIAAMSARYDDAANTRRLPGFASMDLRADWRVDAAWTVGLQLFNVGDTPYEMAWGYNQAGRQALLTLRWAQADGSVRR